VLFLVGENNDNSKQEKEEELLTVCGHSRLAKIAFVAPFVLLRAKSGPN